MTVYIQAAGSVLQSLISACKTFVSIQQ
jgi:hypothetical protein